jgi:hypothetical protein
MTVTSAVDPEPESPGESLAVGEVAVLATHEQVLGGDNGQVHTDCRLALSPRQVAGAQGVLFHASPSGTLAEYARLESGDPGTGFPGMGGWLGRVRQRADSQFRRRAATRQPRPDQLGA